MNWIIGLWCCCWLFSPVLAGPAEEEQLAQLVCKTTRGSTARNPLENSQQLEQVADYLGEVSSEHHLYACSQDYLVSLEQLVALLAEFQSSENVCSSSRLEQIKDYHQRYVSQQKRDQKAPHLAQLFFMQFATQVAQVCERRALDYLQRLDSSQGEHLSRLEKLKAFVQLLGMDDLSRGWDGVYLFWTLVDSLPLPSKFSRYLAPPSKQSTNYRLGLQMRNATGIQLAQAVCRRHLRPLYSQSLLPVLKLVDLGYYPQSGRLLARLNSSASNLYYAAQICETLMPVAAFSDPQLSEDQFVAMTREETQAAKGNLDQMQDQEQVEVEMEMKEARLSPAELEAAFSLDEIKSRVAFRRRLWLRLLRHLWHKQLKGHLRGKIRLLIRRGSKRNELEAPKDVEGALMAASLDEKQASRRKREMYGHMELFSSLFYVIYVILLMAFKLVVFSLPSLVYLPQAMRGDHNAIDSLRSMWSSGFYLDELHKFKEDGGHDD